MAEATFRHGSPVMVDYTPSGGNVAEGAVVVIGTVTGNTAGYGVMAGIAHRPIVNSMLGALAMGGGVYFLQAVKRVQGMNIILPQWKTPVAQRLLSPAAKVINLKQYRVGRER